MSAEPVVSCAFDWLRRSAVTHTEARPWTGVEDAEDAVGKHHARLTVGR
jgi:hypothetical protein